MDVGIKNSQSVAVVNPLPISWLGRSDAPMGFPSWANIDRLSYTQIQNLVAQVGYDKSAWDYTLVGANNQLGRYQFSTKTLESYGLLAPGSNQAYGTDCINYQSCWRPITVKSVNSNSSYNYNVTSQQGFLTSKASQDHLAYQAVYDLYTALLRNTAITDTDTDDVVAGMIYVGWNLGVGTQPTPTNLSGTGAYAWRYFGTGDGVQPFNSGRYAITILSQ